MIGLLLHRWSLLRSTLLGIGLLSLAVAGIHALFIWQNILVPYLFPSTAFLVGLIGKTAIRMQKNAVHEARMETELLTAKLVQDSFFIQNSNPKIPVSTFHSSMEECCGDWWGHVTLDTGYDVICIADATGHGAPASLVTAMAFSTFHAALKNCPNEAKEIPAYVANYMNEILCKTHFEGKNAKTTMTCQIIVVDRSKDQLHFCNAGHIQPILIDHEKAKSISARGNPLGLFRDEVGAAKTVDFEPGKRLFVMSDGVFERENIQGHQMRRSLVAKKLSAWKDRPSEEIIASLMAFADDFSKGVPQTDDVTVLIIG